MEVKLKGKRATCPNDDGKDDDVNDDNDDNDVAVPIAALKSILPALLWLLLSLSWLSLLVISQLLLGRERDLSGEKEGEKHR